LPLILGKPSTETSWLPPLFSPPVIPLVILPTHSWVYWLDCAVTCKAVYELIWLLPPLLIVCKLPLRARLRPRPRLRVVLSNAEGSRRVKVLVWRLFVELGGRPRRRLIVRGSWIRSRGSIGGPVGGSSKGRSNYQCTSISVSRIFSTEVALRCSCL